MSSFLDLPPEGAPDDPSEGDAPTPQEPRAMGAPRGEEFDLSRLDERAPDETKDAPTWSRGWMVLAGLLAAYCFYFWVYGLGVRAQKPLPLGPIVAGNTLAATVRVHVAGGVVHPGVVSLRADARVADAVQKAGGALPGADPNALNLAAFVEDGAKIIVPFKAAPTPKVTPTPVVIVREIPAPTPAPVIEAPPAPSVLSAPPLAKFNPAFKSAAKTTASPKKKSDNIPFLRAHPVDLNHATAEQLQQLPGVGPKMAERIIAYRAENSRFKSVADLDNVKGIGEKKMAVLQDLVTVK